MALALYSWEKHTCKVEAVLVGLTGCLMSARQLGSWDKARGKQDMEGNSKPSFLLQGPWDHARRHKSSNSLWPTQKCHFSITQKDSKLVIPMEGLPLTSVNCRSSPKRFVRITYFEFTSWNKSTAVSIVTAPDLNGDRLMPAYKYCSYSW